MTIFSKTVEQNPEEALHWYCPQGSEPECGVKRVCTGRHKEMKCHEAPEKPRSYTKYTLEVLSVVVPTYAQYVHVRGRRLAHNAAAMFLSALSAQARVLVSCSQCRAIPAGCPLLHQAGGCCGTLCR